jgi:hypothetical protein
VKKFLLIVIGTVGLGLAIRFTINRRDKPKAKPSTPASVQPKQEPPVKSDEVDQHPPEPYKAPEPEPPPPPRIAGSTLISDTASQHFAAAPGVIYYCDNQSVMAAPKDGGTPTRVGDCDGQVFDFTADAQAVFYCDDNKLKRITHGTSESHVVVEDVLCIMSALDNKYAYYVVPGFEDDEFAKNPGVYRVARAGGAPERIHATRPKEQFMLAADSDGLWIGAWSAGTIGKLAKTVGAKTKTVVSGQKGIVVLGVDSTSLYWFSENTTELRRRKKTGGPIEVIGHDVDQEQLAVVDGHAYWFEVVADKGERLMHLAPGAAKAEQLADGLRGPSLQADSEGVYVTELDREGIFMFKR